MTSWLSCIVKNLTSLLWLNTWRWISSSLESTLFFFKIKKKRRKEEEKKKRRRKEEKKKKRRKEEKKRRKEEKKKKRRKEEKKKRRKEEKKKRRKKEKRKRGKEEYLSTKVDKHLRTKISVPEEVWTISTGIITNLSSLSQKVVISESCLKVHIFSVKSFLVIWELFLSSFSLFLLVLW